MDIVYPDKYYSKVKERFPELSDKQIEKIILYGLRSIFMMTHYGVDIKIQRDRFFMYFGEILNNPQAYVDYRRIKLAARTRVLYLRKKEPFAGKYYFVLSEELYKNLRNKKKGKFIPYDYITIYKLQKEAELEFGSYLYEVDYSEDIGFKGKIPTQNLNYRLIAKRDKWDKFIPIASDGQKEKTIKRSPKKGGK